MSASAAALTEEDVIFKRRIDKAIETVRQWESDPDLLKECRARIPLSDLSTNTKYHRDDDRYYHGSALFLKRFCYYFQQDVMTWVNQPVCETCGTHEHQESKGTRGPETTEEQDGGAKRVELYECKQCDNSKTTTFPRYNSVKKLMETRKGRCGEYANLFGFYCRSVGFETRYVLDVTDHVWVECWCETQWIMADACEGLINKASMYESGWGKKLSYQFGVTIDSVTDVSVRYSRKWYDDEYQARRRQVCSSEAVSDKLIQDANRTLQQSLPEKRRAELQQRSKLEAVLFYKWKQAREWTDEEKHDKGRLSGSLTWKLARSEAGKRDESNREEEEEQQKEEQEAVHGWDVELFCPSVSADETSITVSADKIVVAGASCGLSRPNGINVVVVDDKHLGCVLQSRSFGSWRQAADFCSTLPTNRIVGLQSSPLELPIGRPVQETMNRHLGNFPDVGSSGVLFIGQARAEPEWSIFKLSSSRPTTDCSIQVTLKKKSPTSDTDIALKTEPSMVPSRINSRLPESILPLATQIAASEPQKKKAFRAYKETNAYCVGYTTKPGVPVYLLGPSAFPFERLDDSEWKTTCFLPKVLVPDEDDTTDAPGVSFDVPVANEFFTDLFGHSLLKGSETLPTTVALANTRLVALYFSAHWCGPCRHFTPMLSVLYDHLKEEVPVHGMEIVFVSSDRDGPSFQQYFATMPWLSIPYKPMLINRVKMQYGVRGIPSLIVLDSMSGQVVVSANESRGDVSQACRVGDAGIESMFESWLERVPADTQEMVRLLQVSVQEDKLEVATTQDERMEHPYCIRDENDTKEEQQADDQAELIKQVFSKLVEDGTDPNSAAAQAIKMVSEGDVPAPSFGKGNLHDGAVEWKRETLAQDSTPPPPVEEQASRITKNNSSDIKIVTSTLIKYLDNAIREPSNPRFRTIKLSNKIADRITRLSEGLELAEAFKFRLFASYQDFYLSIPLDVDLEELKALLVKVGDKSKAGS